MIAYATLVLPILYPYSLSMLRVSLEYGYPLLRVWLKPIPHL
jgi:hypothetical protein